LRASFGSGLTRPLQWRQAQLGNLSQMLRLEAQALVDAMRVDLGKPPVEAWMTDLGSVRRDILDIRRRLPRWAAPTRARVPVALRPGRARLVPEPLGTALVIGPWNYPVRCTVLPLAFALAAGNTVALKPSELAPATSALLARLIPRYIDERAVLVAEGGPDVARELLAQRWDHIFLTGGSVAGKAVMAAAAQHLTPVTLELGGKNPAIVDATADTRSAARRLAWSKFMNAGQTCVAPDYVLVDRRAEDALVVELARQVQAMYGSGSPSSASLARVVNLAHMDRLVGLLAATAGRAVLGGEHDRSALYLAPTVLSDVGWDDPVMQEELFGPVLPVVTYDDLDEAISQVNARPKPLALYVYSTDAATVQRVVAETSSGSVCVNHSAVQLGARDLPFGGVGASGMGAYHGKAGFDTFSHAKAVLYRPARGEIGLMYPPYGRAKTWLLRRA